MEKSIRELEYKTPAISILFLARLIDLLIASAPMLLIYIFYKIYDWQSLLIVFSIFNAIVFTYFVLIPYWLKGNTLGKLICNLRLIIYSKKRLFFCIILREIYYLYIPLLFQLLTQIIALLFFKYYRPGDNNIDTNGWKIAVMIKNIGNVFFAIWFFYLVITIYLNPNKRSAIDAKFNIKVLYISKKIKQDKVVVMNQENENRGPGLFDMSKIIIDKENNFKETNSLINSLVDKSVLNGAVIKLIYKNNVVFNKAYGYNDLGLKQEMDKNLIFRGYSITKILTAVCTLYLIERNLLNLDDDIALYLPWFKNIKLYEGDKIVIPKNKIKIKNLLTMTSGITYGGKNTNTEKETERVLFSLRNKNLTADEFTKAISEVPLEFEPGTKWKYGLSYDILGAIIEKVTQKKYSDFIKESILIPLGMKDTDFYLKDVSREAFVYRVILEKEKNKLEKYESFNFLSQQVYEEPNIIMGGSGVYTTCDDYTKFLQFLLTGKDIEGNQLISNNLLIQMRTDQVHSLKKYLYMNINDDFTYGYGVRVRINNTLEPLTSLGQFGWDGLLGSSCIIDPRNDLVVCFMASTKQTDGSLVKNLSKAIYKDLENELR
ncbi:transmembrane protein [Spiroplasma corruscae]|uniref:Transmembrane protein n=1 Tax=Spiroplasma corruscae TaxID=216934 RepID=A0A222ENK5_9MOLU|nr:serine hydrolase [Spiroplasma corruscae]ASP27863.1 transmembrane protein [Spiroplasma corruscae]